VIGGSFEIIVNNSEQTAKFYREALGFDVQVGTAFSGDKPRMETPLNTRRRLAIVRDPNNLFFELLPAPAQ
jgi:catechol 2,3-dioxygenase-like lactoylglutathione lyase family enzyme